MPIMIFTMLIVLVLAAAIIAVVVMGMEGTGREQHPEIAEAMAKTARHLNGEAEPPRALVALFDEIDEVPDLRTLGSAATAASARSARSAWSALSARSAGSANAPEDTPDAGTPTWGPAAGRLDQSDESTAQAMSAALAADPVHGDPYGLSDALDPEQDRADARDATRVNGTPVKDTVVRDTVVRVRLPERELRS